MQIITDMSLFANVAAVIFSVSLCLYLLRSWYNQEKRLMTDLPLMFGISFISQSINQLMLILPSIGLVEDSLLYFKLRSLVVLGMTLPLLGASLHIWTRRPQKFKIRVLGGLVLYWVSALILGPYPEIIILFHLPVLLGLVLLLLGTFVITWKTGRLKEVRSDLMVVALLIGFLSQATRVMLMTAGLDVVSYILNTLTVGFATLALTNPWYKDTAVDTHLATPSVQTDYTR